MQILAAFRLPAHRGITNTEVKPIPSGFPEYREAARFGADPTSRRPDVFVSGCGGILPQNDRERETKPDF
jgi:hypothetical protein